MAHSIIFMLQTCDVAIDDTNAVLLIDLLHIVIHGKAIAKLGKGILIA